MGEDEYLGMYYCIKFNNRGKIVLFYETLNEFFWQVINELSDCYIIEQENIKELARFTVLKTYYHEQFHHFSDVCRQLFDRNLEHEIEEALAVAWSHSKLVSNIQKNFPLGVPERYKKLTEAIYQYKRAGYRDWVKYQNPVDFRKGIRDYLGPTNINILESTEIDVAGMILLVERKLEKTVDEEVKPSKSGCNRMIDIVLNEDNLR